MEYPYTTPSGHKGLLLHLSFLLHNEKAGYALFYLLAFLFSLTFAFSSPKCLIFQILSPYPLVSLSLPGYSAWLISETLSSPFFRPRQGLLRAHNENVHQIYLLQDALSLGY